MAMTIADRINEIAVKQGFTAVTGSIVDTLNNLIVNKGGQATGGTIADALKNLESITEAPETQPE